MAIRQRVVWRRLFDLVFSDKELYGGFLVAVIVLISDIADQNGWALVLRIVALVVLIFGLYVFTYRHYRTSLFMQADKHVPIVVAVGVARRLALSNVELARQAINEGTGFHHFKRLENTFNVHYDDLLAHDAQPLPADPAEWSGFLENTQQEIGRFIQHLPGGHVYHVFIHGPSTLAFGIGAIFGTKNRTMGYHYVDGRYRLVLDLSHDSRRVKTGAAVETFNYIDVSYPRELTEETVVILNLAGHSASSAVHSYVETLEDAPAVVEVSNTYGGNLIAEDWVPVVQELYNVFDRSHRDRKVRHIHIFHAMPVPLALGLGIALGTFVPVTVYNWERAQETYHPVLRLNQIESRI